MALDKLGKIDKDGDIFEFSANNPIKFVNKNLKRYANLFPNGYALTLWENRYDDDKYIKILKKSEVVR